jgi:hypothetical protein
MQSVASRNDASDQTPSNSDRTRKEVENAWTSFVDREQHRRRLRGLVGAGTLAAGVSALADSAADSLGGGVAYSRNRVLTAPIIQVTCHVRDATSQTLFRRAWPNDGPEDTVWTVLISCPPQSCR